MATRLAAPQRRQELMRAATVVFSRSNYRATRVGDIAAEAGVSEPILYRHFPSKKVLFCELLERVGRRILENWEEAVLGAPDALEALRRAGQVYVANLAVHPAEAKLQFQALAESDDPEIAGVLRSNHERYAAFFEALLNQGRSEGVIRSDIDPNTAAWILDGMGVAFTVRDLLFAGESPASRPDGDLAVIDSMIAWLGVLPEPDPRSNEAEETRTEVSE